MDDDRARGAMLGALLGDSFGRPLEGAQASDGRLPVWVERRRHGSDPLGYSDDSEMMIFVAESILECGGLNSEHLLRWMAQHHEPARGYGKGTRAAFAAAALGQPAREAARACWPEGSTGNGAAVRVAPIACLYAHDGVSLQIAAAAAAKTTHANALAVDGAVVMTRAIASLLRAPRGEMPAIQRFMTELKAMEFESAARLALAATLAEEHAAMGEAVATLGNGVVALESVPLALFCFLRWGPDFETTIVQTALCGGDVDSIAAMTGALAGALVGEGGLPKSWLVRLERGAQTRVAMLADRICDLSRSATSSAKK